MVVGSTGMSEPRSAANPLVVVDAANVVGAIPDGWWRRRAEAAALLRDALEPLAGTGLPAGALPAEVAWLTRPPLEVVLVVEGAAARISGTRAVPVIAARGSGDDAIVTLVAAERAGRRIAVVTADRALRSRVLALGAVVVGPGTLPRRSRLPGPKRSDPTAAT
jgi:hypothetical protein